jgi:hypothetical protein
MAAAGMAGAIKRGTRAGASLRKKIERAVLLHSAVDLGSKKKDR